MYKVGIFLVTIFTFILFSCEEELRDFRVKNESNAIVVSGEISNKKGPYLIRLNRPTSYSPYDVREFTGIPISNAKVEIRDNLGNIFPFKESSKGVYESSLLAFQGVEGNSYVLKIITTDGKTIESRPSKILNVPQITQFDYVFKQADLIEESSFLVKAKIQDKSNLSNYYLIKKQEYIQFLSTCPPPPPPPANPPPCYSKCWRAPLNTQPILFDDFLIDGRSIETQLANVPLEDITNYGIDIKVYNIEKDHYQYWKRLEDQRLLTGSIFDKVPAQVIGNLVCTNDPTLEVLGYFGAVSITNKRLVIDRFSHLDEKMVQELSIVINKNETRNPKKVISNCWEAAWINYNLGLEIPPFKD